MNQGHHLQRGVYIRQRSNRHLESEFKQGWSPSLIQQINLFVPTMCYVTLAAITRGDIYQYLLCARMPETFSCEWGGDAVIPIWQMMELRIKDMKWVAKASCGSEMEPRSQTLSHPPLSGWVPTDKLLKEVIVDSGIKSTLSQWFSTWNSWNSVNPQRQG